MTRSLTALGLLAVGASLAACAPSASTMIGGANPGNAGLNPAQRLTVAQPAPAATARGLTLTSPTFANGGAYPAAQVASGFGCSGPNISPALNWTGVPAGTQSLVLTTYDPDAPTGSGFWHWSVYNIPATATGLAQGAGNPGGTLPAGARQLNNEGGQPGFVGACPPVGDRAHRYVFTLYALSGTLELPAGTTPAVLGFMLNGQVLAKTSITAYYGR
ncbi:MULTISPECIES: YbhB/YbcL family Raf kinase inhibitor-like protein [Deinococcus]|uniref:YbhB/YbcL family Raf kinase inhibitor-like protein n=1 Tax=Deinococcus rufus TaxID=2136097 RepID=A0ABV7ZD01_9DEIO|nr:YbhB/YbcL family Raf kinase inhibitor-like protein [Deinococcus sp. AB2017081]WQE93614.1 YbhB/YbcL family Raf kinase inhibitor-like protein [Deinococcus sp. AB2017081]